MEVGIEDCLHIEFEYDKGRYHLKDTVVGKIYFLLVSVSPNHFCCTLKPGSLAPVGASAHGEDVTTDAGNCSICNVVNLLILTHRMVWMSLLAFSETLLQCCSHGAGADKAEAHGDRDPAAGADGHGQLGPE